MNAHPAKNNRDRRPPTRVGGAQDASSRGADAAPETPISADISGRPRRGLYGCVERIDADGISGWLIDTGNVSVDQDVSVELDGVELFRGKADILRGDVSHLLGCTAYSGFEFRWRDLRPAGPLPEAQSPDGRPGRLTVMATNGLELPLATAVGIDGDQVYAWVEYYLSRLLLVLGTSQAAASVTLSDRELIASAFDAPYYLALHPEAGSTESAAIDHFLSSGWQEGCDPNPHFSCADYLQSNTDVQGSGINPFLHYLRAGKYEGRLPRAPGGFRSQVLKHQQPLGDVVRSWRRSDSLRSLACTVILRKLDTLLEGTAPTGVVVSYSHDDYTRNVGGVQLCLAIEQKSFNEDGVVYLHLSPWQPAPLLYAGRDPGQVPLRLLCNGQEIGNTLGSEMVAVVESLRERWAGVPTWLAVHALHGHAPEHVQRLHAALQPERSLFWLHDFFSVCTGYNLLRNQVAFCSAPPADSAACTICLYGASRQVHLQRMAALFEAVPFDAVAPSQHTATLWRQSTALPVGSVIVAPHCTIATEGQRLGSQPDWDAGEDAADSRPVRVAYLGHPTVHKGWPVFQELVRQLCGLGQYEFWHLGTEADTSLPIRFSEVKVTPEETGAMIDALEAANIDVVVQWSIWPETFGIAPRECVAAGAMLVTSADSGAVADFVRASGAGVVLDSEDALLAHFRSDAVTTAVQQRRSQGVPVGSLHWGRLSASLVRAEPLPIEG